MEHLRNLGYSFPSVLNECVDLVFVLLFIHSLSHCLALFPVVLLSCEEYECRIFDIINNFTSRKCSWFICYNVILDK